MATIQQLKTQIENANTLGRTNLSEKGVTVEETATTYDIMTAIAEIVSGGGGGTEYTSIIYNTDNTITLTDKDGIVHTMSCTYENGKLIGVTYDGKAVDLTYNGDALVKVGKTAVNVEKAPSESTTIFNIAYGETAPEDTSKLWIKANEPANVSVGSDIDGVESIGYLDYTLPVSLSGVIRCVKVANNVYIFGGSSNIYKYNMETKEISTTSATYNFYNRVSVTTVGTKIYLFGGITSLDGYGTRCQDITIFDTETDQILASYGILPKYFNGMGCVAVGTKIYLFGGTDTTSPTSSKYIFNTIYVFDTDTNSLTTLTNTLPFACYEMTCSLVGNKIYLFGGSILGGYTDTIIVFDIETKNVTTLDTKLPTACSLTGCGVIGTKVYLFGGRGASSLDTINVFDTNTETVTTLDTTLPIVSSSMGTVTNGNKIYLFGGTNDTNSIKVFTLTHELANGDIEIQSGLLKNKFNLINTENNKVEISVENVYIGNTNNEAELCEAYLHNGTEWVVI